MRVLLLLAMVGCGVPDDGVESLEQASIFSFGQMISCTACPIFTINGSGCYCGLGNVPELPPADGTDACCQCHDACWKARPAGCDCATIGLERGTHWQCKTFDNGKHKVTCQDTRNECAAYCCACDAAAANCFNQAANGNPPPTDAKGFAVCDKFVDPDSYPDEKFGKECKPTKVSCRGKKNVPGKKLPQCDPPVCQACDPGDKKCINDNQCSACVDCDVERSPEGRTCQPVRDCKDLT